MCYFRTQNGPFVLNNFFWVQTNIITFIYLFTLFIVQNLKKFLQRIQSYEDVPFLGPKWSICPPKKILKKIINIILVYLLAPFIVQNFKKILQWIQSYEDVQFLGPKRPICPNENFFRKSVTEPCFFHSCLSTSQKLKSNITLLVKY